MNEALETGSICLRRKEKISQLERWLVSKNRSHAKGYNQLKSKWCHRPCWNACYHLGGEFTWEQSIWSTVGSMFTLDHVWCAGGALFWSQIGEVHTLLQIPKRGCMEKEWESPILTQRRKSFAGTLASGSESLLNYFSKKLEIKRKISVYQEKPFAKIDGFF